MIRSSVVILLSFILSQVLSAGPPPEKRIFNTRKVIEEPPVIDGILDDMAWQGIGWETGFTQHEPYDGKAPSQETSFKILYDDENIYVAFRAYDSSPDSIVRRMTRKDDIDGDMVAVQLDSYFDHRTAFIFAVSAAGVKADGLFSNDGDNEDFTWDPIWYVKTSVDREGWTAEMKIPLSQLRFDHDEEQVWGLQALRQLYRKDELSLWQPIARDAPGWVHLFGEIHGISGIKPKRQVEIAPYAVASTQRFEKEEGNPFATGKLNTFDAGVDGKIGITNNMILDFTVNPDFGQVEADPSQVNLSAFEIFFEEKRPFFIEGKNILNFPLNYFDGGDMAAEGLFYSRRIGRTPQFYPDVQDDEYVDFPSNTPILGAAKLSGKTKKGLSIGILESVTAREKAEIDDEGERRFETVEPLTNYSITRIQKDWNEGNTFLGGIVTTTNRSIENPGLEFLHTAAYTGGLDFSHSWKERTYTVMARTYFSHVRGDEEALLRTQQSSARYFQRPGNDYARLDSGRTTLSGHGGTVAIGKFANGHWRYAAFVFWKSPGFETNDIGFMTVTDRIMQVFWAGYRIWEPVSIFREVFINFNQWTIYDFGGNLNYNGGNVNAHTQFTNYWFLDLSINPEFRGRSNTMLRGGPTFLTPGSMNIFGNINSDQRKKFTYGGYTSLNMGMENSGTSQNYGAFLSYRPYEALNISLSPSIGLSDRNLQYITTTDPGQDERYIFGAIDQKTLRMSVRINYSLSPNFTIQYWGQPFVSVGDYSDFKRITDPVAGEYRDRYHSFGDDEISYNATDNYYQVSDGVDPDYTFDNPDFNVKEFKSNFVARWEYVPGSTLYIVWSQGRSGYDPTGIFDFGQDMNDLFKARPHNIFLVKLSYRFVL